MLQRCPVNEDFQLDEVFCCTSVLRKKTQITLGMLEVITNTDYLILCKNKCLD